MDLLVANAIFKCWFWNLISEMIHSAMSFLFLYSHTFFAKLHSNFPLNCWKFCIAQRACASFMRIILSSAKGTKNSFISPNNNPHIIYVYIFFFQEVKFIDCVLNRPNIIFTFFVEQYSICIKLNREIVFSNPWQNDIHLCMCQRYNYLAIFI